MAEKKDVEGARLIERAFCLKQASIESVHEKSVRHGHISTLHIWPARRPLAACRAAIIATLLPDPGSPETRSELLERLGGRVVTKAKKTKKNGKLTIKQVEETDGGVLAWGRESTPDIQWFKDEIHRVYGRAPKILDPFAGGGAIPLEAMRLGCEATAIDINPVAWFVEKCTLDYPQRLSGQKLPLPKFAQDSDEFMSEYSKGNGKGSKGKKKKNQTTLGIPEADLAWHVRAWGLWVLQEARRDLEKYYPIIDGKPTVAYLWARTVRCKNCRATIPLLKTRWLCKKENKRALLTMQPNADKTGVEFGIWNNVPREGGNAAQVKARDKELGRGTMNRSGAWCPCCGKPGTVAMDMSDIRYEGISGKIGSIMTAVVVDGKDGKEYRLPRSCELKAAEDAQNSVNHTFDDIPFGVPEDPTPVGGNGVSRAFSVDGYGLDKWQKLFIPRQLLALGELIRCTRNSRDEMTNENYPPLWIEALQAYLSIGIDRLADYNSTICNWAVNGEYITHTFQRYALPIKWDFCEVNPLSGSGGDYCSGLDWVARVIQRTSISVSEAEMPHVINNSAILHSDQVFDIIITDPPYYDAIPYSDLMDFFYIWLRRTLNGLSPEIDDIFANPLAPKWDHGSKNGELIDDSNRFGGDEKLSKAAYEEGMARAFTNCQKSLTDDGRLVIVFAHKQPDAWETLVSAVIRAGFTVVASWPIQTEMSNRTRAQTSAALSSSVWLVCKKRSLNSMIGWDNRILDEMRSNVSTRLKEYWDAGIRGPDFVWAATGPALEAYSKHPIVKRADDPGKLLTVSDFLKQVRKMVVEFVVGRLLTKEGEDVSTAELDDVTTYYLLHRNDFKFNEAPVGACILYAVSCNLSDTKLVNDLDILSRSGGKEKDEEEDEEEESDEEGESESGGATVKLKPWNRRKCRNLGQDNGGQPSPMIDRIHHLMYLWKEGEEDKVDDYLSSQALLKNDTFHRLLQALIEMSEGGSEERSLLEGISNHTAAKGGWAKGTRDWFN